MTIIVTLDGKLVPASSVNVAITSPVTPVPPTPIPPTPTTPTTTLTVGPGKMYPTIKAAAAAATAGCAIVVDPGTYKEVVHFPAVPLTLRSAISGQKAIVNATGLAPIMDQGALLFEADYTIDGFEVFGATGVNSTNAAGVRTNAANSIKGIIRNSNIHHCQTNILHTGGTLTVDASDVHHNTGDGQCHTLYCAQFGTNVPTQLTVTNSRIWHTANGNLIKSNAKSTTVTGCSVGTIAVAPGTSINRPGEAGNPAWYAPAPAAGEWLIYHTDAGKPCVSNGYTYDGNAFDIGQGGAFAISNCNIFSGGSSKYMLTYGYESASNGNAGGTITSCNFYIERDPTAIGNRVPNSTIAISKCTFAGVYYPPATQLDCTDVTGKPVPGAVITLTP